MRRGLLAKLGADERGGVAIMAAAFGTLLCVLAALAVDVGSITLTARHLQGTADLAALSAARDLDRAELAGRATAVANLPQLESFRIDKGLYVADATLSPVERFSAQGANANAARVVLTAPARLHFARWLMKKDEIYITRQAVAALPGGRSRAVFSIGSRLASLDSGIANSLLSALLGSKVSLKVADYNALADARINLLYFTDALAADIGLAAGDYDALLRHDVTTGQLLKALELVASSESRSVLSQLTSLPLHTKIRLEDLIGVEADARQGLRSRLDTDVSALEILMATLETGNGQRQLALDVGARAGLADVDLIVGIGERPNKSPWLTVTGTGSPIIRTAQARVFIKAQTASQLAGLARVNLPILIEVAPSEARLDQVECRPSVSARILARPGLARARIGNLNESRIKDFTSEIVTSDAILLTALGGLVRITAKADLQISDRDWQAVTFTQREVDEGRLKSVRSRAFTTGLISSLLKEVDIDIVLAGLPLLSVQDLLKALDILLAPLRPPLDAILQPLLNLLGLKLGEADLIAHAIECPQTGHGPILVG